MQVTLDDSGNFAGRASGEQAVNAQAQVLIAHMRARLFMRLGLYGLAALFVLTAAALIVFAPDGRETGTTIVAMALFALAAGAAGFGTFAIKTPLLTAEARPHDPHVPYRLAENESPPPAAH